MQALLSSAFFLGDTEVAKNSYSDLSPAGSLAPSHSEWTAVIPNIEVTAWPFIKARGRIGIEIDKVTKDNKNRVDLTVLHLGSLYNFLYSPGKQHGCQ